MKNLKFYQSFFCVLTMALFCAPVFLDADLTIATYASLVCWMVFTAAIEVVRASILPLKVNLIIRKAVREEDGFTITDMRNCKE